MLFAGSVRSDKVLGDSTYLTQTGQVQQNQDQEQNQIQNSDQNHQQNQEQNQEQNHQLDVKPLENVAFKAQESHRNVYLNTDSSIELSTGDGHLQITAKHKDGTETKLDSNSLNLINENLKGEDLQIATTSGNGFSIKHGEYEAKTHFPLSINPTTNELTVTTPAGTKVVAVLPDQAVNNLIRQKYIDVVASSSIDTGINLDQYASQSAFMVNGILHKKLFGLFPVNVDKTAYVSTENGQVLNVTQSLISKLLDLLSTQ